MSFSTVDELGNTLVGLRLVEPQQLRECLFQLPAAGGPPALLRSMEQKGYLTSYQIGRLEKGETDGLVVNGYKLLYRNAAGSFARVFRAQSVADGRMVGLKVLRQRLCSDPQAVQLFLREGEVGKRLIHRNIVPIYEVGSDRGQHYFSMEFVEGGNFRDFLKIRKKLSPEEATRYILDMAEGLSYALSQGYTHRDLKLTNVLISSQGVAKLVDFGLAGDEATLARMGDDMQRAVEYAALEKGTGAAPNDPRSDLYFLGAIYYELLTGTAPYEPTRSREERKQFSRYSNIRPVSSVDPAIPREVAEIVTRLMHTNPSERYQTPAEVVRDLKSAVGGESEAAAEQAGPERGSIPTILCIESRPKQQDVLREYFSKRGFRVLVLSDLQRGLHRISQNPPDCVMLMGEPLGDGILGAYQEAVQRARKSGTPVISVLAEKQNPLRDRMPETDTARVLVQPVTLRDLRREISRAINRSDLNGD